MANKKVSLKNKEGDTLYPKTLLEHVFNAAGTALSAILNAMNTVIDGKLGKTEKAASAVTADRAIADGQGNNIDQTYARKADIGNAYKVKGTVQNTAALHGLETVAQGDVYNIAEAGTLGADDFPAGSNVVYISDTPNQASDDASWDLLGGTYDLSEYAKKTDLIDMTYTIDGSVDY